MVLERSYRGTGGIIAWYPRTIAAWREAHPDDVELGLLAARFCASAPCRAWRELSAAEPGLSLEEAAYRFFVENEVGAAAVREEEFLGAIVRSLAVTPRSHFLWPESVRPAPGGGFALTRTHILHAALDGSYLRGPVTPLIAELLDGASCDAAAIRFNISLREATQVREALRGKRLLE
jgi:hypothetical protein